jgi:superfamily II DNA/RNA helicase
MDLGVVDCVISYDSPKYVKNYIHRAGRAARAGRPGTAITILMDSEVKSKYVNCVSRNLINCLIIDAWIQQTIGDG